MLMRNLGRFFILSALAASVACKPKSEMNEQKVAPPAPPVAKEVPPPVEAKEMPSAKATLDPTPLDEVLKKYVKETGVDYKGLKADAEAMGKLKSFLEAAGKMPENEPMASWLNAYNAFVITEVAERYPVKSVMDVKDFFKALKRPIAGKEMSLDEIENVVVRPRFEDARVHFALNCGAKSCPKLAPEAFMQEKLDAQLDALVKKGVADDLHVEVKDGKVVLSEIFFWFEDDFKRDGGSVIGWIKKYAGDKLKDVADEAERERRKYDWALNEA